MMITLALENKIAMIQIMNNLPDHVLGVRATGEVTKEDLEGVLIPAMDALVDRTEGIHYLLVLDTSVKNWNFGAWISDAKLGLKYFSKWHKIAVVTDEEAVIKATSAFSALVPGEAKGYTHAELQQAIDWVSAHDSKDVPQA